MYVSIVDTSNVSGKVFPSMSTISISFLVKLFSQSGQAQNGRPGLGTFAGMKGLGIGKLPGFAQDLSHPPESLFPFLFLFRIGFLKVSHGILMKEVAHSETLCVVAANEE